MVSMQAIILGDMSDNFYKDTFFLAAKVLESMEASYFRAESSQISVAFRQMKSRASTPFSTNDHSDRYDCSSNLYGVQLSEVQHARPTSCSFSSF